MSGNHNRGSTNRVREHFPEGVAGVADQCYEAVEEAVQENPVAITLAVFGIGLAIGTAAAVMLSRPRRPSHLAMAESIGRRVLDSVSEYLPASLQAHLHP